MKQKTETEIANRKAVRAAQARARRVRKGATPRSESKSEQFRQMGVSADAYYSRQRRKRLRNAVTFTDDGETSPIIESDPDRDIERRFPVAAPANSDSSPITTETAAPGSGQRLYSDLWGGWKPIPSIRTVSSITNPTPGQGQGVSRADALIEACRNLPGGADPTFQATLRRLVAAADAL